MKIIYGIGNIGKEYIDTLLRNNVHDILLVDSQEKLWGKKYRDLEICDPKVFFSTNISQIIVSTSWDTYLEVKNILKVKYKINEEKIEWYANVLLIKNSIKIEKTFLNDVLLFCKEAQMLRNGENCAKYYNNKYDTEDCTDAINYLFTVRKMGAYIYGKDQDPQQYMRKFILDNISTINKESNILEIGPGNLPLFYESEYKNWYGVDFNYTHGVIDFNGNKWGDFYNKIFSGGWENLEQTVNEKIKGIKFDLVCGSHSFEHCSMPITALKEASLVLKESGYLVIFIPDGYSTWPGNYDKTHTIYPNIAMLQEFFKYANTFELICCKQFRTNMDLVVIAKKKSNEELHD